MEPSKKSTYIIAAAAFVILAVAIYFLFIFQRGEAKIKSEEFAGEVKNVSELEVAKRPYVTLTPTGDGAEIIISVENMSFFDKIEYELTYLADNPQVSGEKIERGATGTDVNTKDEKYKKSMLLGTASRGTRSPDTGVTDGVLTMHLVKGDIEYLSESKWDLFEAGATVKSIADRDDTFVVENLSLGKDYWIIIADTVGLPPNSPSDYNLTSAVLPSKGIFSIAPEFSKSAKLTINLKDDLKDPKLYSFREDIKWQEREINYDSAKKVITASIGFFAAFVITSQVQ